MNINPIETTNCMTVMVACTETNWTSLETTHPMIATSTYVATNKQKTMKYVLNTCHLTSRESLPDRRSASTGPTFSSTAAVGPANQYKARSTPGMKKKKKAMPTR